MKSPQNQYKERSNDYFEYVSESKKNQKERLTQIIILVVYSGRRSSYEKTETAFGEIEITTSSLTLRKKCMEIDVMRTINLENK